MSLKWLPLLIAPALLAIACGGDGSSPTPNPTPAPSPGVTQLSPTPEPTLTMEPAPTTGSPFAIVDLPVTWEARGMAVTLSDPNAGSSGFSATVFDARLIRGEDSVELSILVYADIEVIKEDWVLTVGESPMPKEGRAVPDQTAIWWNENIVVIVRSSVGGLGRDALDAFLALGETPAPAAAASTACLDIMAPQGWFVWSISDGGSIIISNLPPSMFGRGGLQFGQMKIDISVSAKMEPAESPSTADKETFESKLQREGERVFFKDGQLEGRLLGPETLTGFGGITSASYGFTTDGHFYLFTQLNSDESLNFQAVEELIEAATFKC